MKVFISCYISVRLRSVVLCGVSERNTWSASVVYKDGAEEHMIVLIPNCVTWQRKRQRNYLLTFGDVG